MHCILRIYRLVFNVKMIENSPNIVNAHTTLYERESFKRLHLYCLNFVRQDMLDLMMPLKGLEKKLYFGSNFENTSSARRAMFGKLLLCGIELSHAYAN